MKFKHRKFLRIQQIAPPNKPSKPLPSRSFNGYINITTKILQGYRSTIISPPLESIKGYKEIKI